MAWQFTVYSIPPLVAACISLALAGVAWNHRRKPLARPFVVFCLALSLWALSYAIQLGFSDLARQMAFERLGFVGAAIVPAAWLVLTARYSGRDGWISRRTLALLSVEPLVTLVLVWTNRWHRLIWVETSMDEVGGVPIVAQTFGAWYRVNLAYSYLLVAVGLALLLGVLFRSSRLHRKQTGTLVVGAVVPLAANVAFTLGASPIPEIDLTTFSFSVTGALFALALFRFDLLDRAPVARQRMIDELGDGFLVLDGDGRIVEANANARRILDAPEPVGHPAIAVLPRAVDDLDGAVVRGEGARRYYHVRHVPLRDFRGERAGSLIALRDVTDREEYEQRLEVANRLLRHNLRNESNVILAHADALSTVLEGDDVDRARTIQAAAERIADLSEKAVRMAETLRVAGGKPTVVDVTAVVDRNVDRFGESAPDATLSLDRPESALASTIDRDLLETAVGNLIENAIEHHDGTPRVEVTVEAGDPVRIRIADDGPGIPAMEHEVLADGRETSLKHGSGVGLWLVHWVVSASDGDLRFEENEPTGTVVTIELPAA